jgi:aspartate/methionine/tyrosine aminotransferase
LVPLKEIEDSVSYSIFGKVSEMASRGKKVYPLAIGEPSFSTPKAIITKAYESMRAGATHYVSSYGLPEVREAIRDKVRRHNDIDADISNTMFVSTKLAIYASIVAVAEVGGQVLIPDPGYFYSQPVVLAGASPVWYRLAEDYSLDLDEIRKKATGKTRAIIVNTPSNPTGKMLRRGELKALLEFCKQKSITVISDESYEDLVYDTKHVSIGSFEPGPSSVISLFSLSKSYAMTGWRAGYVVADSQTIRTMVKFIEHTLSCFPPFIQYASAYALRSGGASTLRFRVELHERRALIERMMRRIPRLQFARAEGAFYAFPRYDARVNSIEFSRTLLESKGVAVLPGSIFGPAGEKHLRITFAAPRGTIEVGMRLLGEFLEDIPR